MSPIGGLINTPNLNLCLSSSKTQVQSFKRDIQFYTRLNNECTLKTQLTHASINCVLKDSSCDTPLPKILKLAILDSNASSSSTKAFECPHTNDDSIFTCKGIINLKFRNQIQRSHSQR